MNLKKLSLLLVSLLLAVCFSISALATDGTVNIDVLVPRGSVAAGDTFDVSVVFRDGSQLGSNLVSGVQVEIEFDTAKLSSSTENIALNAAFAEECGSFHGEKVLPEGKVIFVAIKKDFTEETGFSSSLSEIFKVTFTAKAAISDLTEVITVSAIPAVLGDSYANEVENVTEVKTTGISSVIETADESLAVFGSTEAGFILQSDEAKSATAMTSLFAVSAPYEVKIRRGANYVTGTAKVYTGDVVELWNGSSVVDSAEIAVKGDVQASGDVNVFDAVKTLKAATHSATLTPSEIIAADTVASNGSINVFDALAILKYVVNRKWN